MKYKFISYETPQFEVIRIEVESSILTASNGNVEDPIEGEESDW